MPDTALDVYRRWTRDGKPVFVGGKWPGYLNYVEAGVSTPFFLNLGAERRAGGAVTVCRISATDANALCRAQAVGELMADGWIIEPLPASGEYLLRNAIRAEAMWSANLDDALAEALARVNARP